MVPRVVGLRPESSLRLVSAQSSNPDSLESSRTNLMELRCDPGSWAKDSSTGRSRQVRQTIRVRPPFPHKAQEETLNVSAVWRKQRLLQ